MLLALCGKFNERHYISLVCRKDKIRCNDVAMTHAYEGAFVVKG